MLSTEEIKLSECSLSQFTEALIRGNGFGHEAIFIKKIFGDFNFAIVEDLIGSYTHNIAQNCMSDFFESQGFKKIKETFYDEGGEVAVTYENLEVAPKKFKKVYKSAFIIFEKEENKICLSINKIGRDIAYRLYASHDYENLLVNWFEYARKNNVYRNKKITADCSFLELSDVSWEDIIMEPETVRVVREHVNEIFEYSEYLKINKISVKRGIILAGPPGTGKTMLCKVLAKEMTGTVIYAMPSQLERAEDIRRVCEMAKDLAPCMLIIEDIDFIAEHRDQNINAGKMMELMNYMDGLQDFTDIVTLATTNAEDKIEEAVKNRPGRFDRVIQIPRPSDNERLRMLKLFCSNYTTDHVNLDLLVKQTAKLSGAHIRHICETAAFKAIRAKSVESNKKAIVKDDHFKEALKEINNEAFSSFHKARNQNKKIMGFSQDFDD